MKACSIGFFLQVSAAWHAMRQKPPPLDAALLWERHAQFQSLIDATA
jgi:hypothetical protein